MAQDTPTIKPPASPEEREENRVVRAYLDALHRPQKRGRKRSPDRIRRQLEALSTRITEARDPLAALSLREERLRLRQELEKLEAANRTSRDQLEEQFVAVASRYARRKGISYTAWREAGVSKATLRRAGIDR